MVKLIFSDQPGMHERHLRRKVNNPLFAESAMSQQMILDARELDQQEFEDFMQEFHALARDASQLDASVDSEALIELKTRLDKSYERCCGQMGTHDEIKQGLKTLIEAIMGAVVHAAANDPGARSKLEDEIAARQQHFELLQYPLIVDMLRPDSPLNADELVPSLLSAADDEALAAAGLFNAEQRDLVCQQAQALIDRVLDAGIDVSAARCVLESIRQL